MSANPINLAEVMAAHQPTQPFGTCADDDCGNAAVEWPCLPYRLAEALIVERERVARVTACAEAYGYERIPLALDDRPYRVDIDAILASIPEDDPGEDPWGGANLEPAFMESNIGHPEGASVAHRIPRGAERSQEIATDPDRSQLDGPSETRSD